jgi:hypothetical protein
MTFSYSHTVRISTYGGLQQMENIRANQPTRGYFLDQLCLGHVTKSGRLGHRPNVVFLCG